jgi:glucose-1-phosphate thymidylyltransferase
MGMARLKGLVLAAERREDELALITGTRAPQTLPVANKPLISWAIESMRDCGVEEVAVVVSRGTLADVAETLGNGEPVGVNVTYVESERMPRLGTAMQAAEPFLRGHPFVAHSGECIFADPLTPFVEEFQQASADALLLVRGDEEERPDELDSRRRQRAVEGRSLPPPGDGLAGVYMFSPMALEAAFSRNGDGPGAIDLLGLLLDRGGRIEARPTGGFWNYTGTVEQLLAANTMVLDRLQVPSRHIGGDADVKIEGRVSIHPTARLERASLRGPAVIGPGASVIDAYVGPYTSIGEGASIENAEIEHSIVLERAQIRHIGRRLETSLIGPEAIVARDFEIPSALRLKVGRRAEVSLA